MLEMGVTFDIAQLVADNEIVAMTKHCRRGIPVSDATLMTDEIATVGPGGEFLSAKGTLAGMRSQSDARIIDRQVREAGGEAGSPAFYETARKEAKRILAEHQVPPLPKEVSEEVRSIIAKAEREAGVAPPTT
ncbi:MAG: hypothetical protein A2133_07465 [Actinobacteria bacterium RBG_16_64_13]|nr:MAG: hypothetical protein A2133_07465 [Actinobacteria bacterium RBG_16_64_13]